MFSSSFDSCYFLNLTTEFQFLYLDPSNKSLVLYLGFRFVIISMYHKFSYQNTPSEAIFVSYGQFKELGQKSINLPDITFSFLLIFTGGRKRVHWERMG